MDTRGDGGLTAPGLFCGSCGAQSGPTAKFCSECGTQLMQSTQSAEYKQVTVLFADVVHSMDIAAAVGAERLREIMAELADRCAAVVKRYGGTVDKFTGDGSWRLSGHGMQWRTHRCSHPNGVVEHGQRREPMGPHAAGIRGGWLGCPRCGG